MGPSKNRSWLAFECVLEAMVIILIGVAGAGKTTIGKLLAEELGWPFYEGDHFHPQTNIEKMRNGLALTDEDREPWLDNLQKLINGLIHRGQPGIIACSALRRAYREYLQRDNEAARFIYLKGDYDLIRKRLEERKDHFMGADLLYSQFRTLEEPDGVLVVDILQEPGVIVSSLMRKLRL